MDDVTVATAEEGLFLTAVATQRETRKTVALDPNKKKLINVLNMSDLPPRQYEEHVSGPMKPGLYFYKWLLRGAGLAVSIPDTLIVEKNIVRLVYNDPSTGQVIKARPQSDSKKNKKKFIRDVLHRFLDPPDRRDEGASHAARNNTVLARQVVGVIKKPYWRSSVGNEVEVLQPMSLVAHLMDAVDGQEGPYVIQKFVRYRGRRPCFYRCFWRAASPGAPRTVTVWNISSTEPAEEFQGAPVAVGGAGARHVDKRQDYSELGLLDGSGDVRDNAAFRAEVDGFVDNQSPLDRSAVQRAGMQAHRMVGRTHLCCLTDPDGSVSDGSCNKVIVTKVIGRVADELDPTIDKLVSWMENAVAHKENLSIQLTDLVVDFIRDDFDRWHMIQVKGFRVSDATQGSIQRWISARDEGLDGDLAMPAGLEATAPKEDTKLNQQKELKEKLQNRRGIQCKLCGLCFVEGQTISVPEVTDGHKASNGLSSSMAAEHIIAENGEKEVPAFGYQISMQMACQLVELYRDANFPLSLIARDILMDYSKVADLPQRGSGPRGGSLATTEGLKKNAPREETHQGGLDVNLKKKRSGWMLVCYHCFTILEGHHYHQHMSEKLYKVLGVDTTASNTAVVGEPKKMMSATAPVRPRSANKARRSASESQLPAPPPRDEGYYSTQCVRYGKPEPWTRSAFERECGQYRLAVLAHYITDARISPDNSAYGMDCCLTYSLGNNSVSLPYKNRLESEDFEQKLIWIKQCRLHYMFATKRNAHELFRDKEIEFHLFVTRREDVYAQQHLPRSSSTGALGQKHSSPAGLQWESTFKVSLHQLKWLHCANADQGLLEKVDMFVPITTNSMGSMVLKLSVALEFTAFVPIQAASCHYLREKGVFWPPSSYQDGTPLPSNWLALMTQERKMNEFNKKKTPVTSHFYKGNADNSPSANREKRTDSMDSTGVPPPSTPGSPAPKGGRQSIGLKTAEAAAMATDKYMKRNVSSSSLKGSSKNTVEASEEEDAAAIDLAKFDRISSIIPFVGRVFDRQRQVDNDGGVHTVTALNAISDALAACLLDPTLLAMPGDPPRAPGDPAEAHDETAAGAIESLQAAIREMVLDDRIPLCMSWAGFIEKLAAYVGVILKKEARDKLVSGVNSKMNVSSIQPDGSSVPLSGGDNTEGGSMRSNMLSTTRAIRVSKTLLDISHRLRGTALDVTPGAGNIHKVPVTEMSLDNAIMLPVSRDRKYRRLMFALSIFEDVSKRGDMVDAAELKQYLENERNSLIHAVTLIRAGVMTLPSVSANFVPELSEQFSLSRGVICSHLLASSDKLNQLFSRYDTQGVAIISQIGFLKTVEECFSTMSENNGAIDKILQDLKEIADQLYRFKYKKMVGGKTGPGDASPSPQRSSSPINMNASPHRAKYAVPSPDAISLRGLGLKSSPFNRSVDEGDGTASPTTKPKVTLFEAGHFVKSIIHSVGVNNFTRMASSPPLIQLTCDVHGDELFFFADLCCTLCERDNHRAGGNTTSHTKR